MPFLGDEKCHVWPSKSGDSFSKVFGNLYLILTKLGVLERIEHISMLGNLNYQVFVI